MAARADDWREQWRSWSEPDTLAHPKSPAGGGGSGAAQPPGPGAEWWCSSPELPHPNSPCARHFDFQTALPRRQILASRSTAEKLGLAAERALPKLPGEARGKVRAMLTPEALATLAAIAAVWGASHWIGVGEAVDVLLVGWGVWTLGLEAVDVAKDLYTFVTSASSAQTERDLDRAADHFARAIAVIGVDGLAAILAHRAFQAAREIDRGAGGAARAASEAPPPAAKESAPRKAGGTAVEEPAEAPKPRKNRMPTRQNKNIDHARTVQNPDGSTTFYDLKGRAVTYSKEGYPDFSPHAEAEVRLKGLKGTMPPDDALANQAVGLKSTPDGYTWHHVEDGKTMQLLPSDLHSTFPHTGGAARLRLP